MQLYLATLDQTQPTTPGQPQEETALTPATGDNNSLQQTLEPSWSPDGHFLAYVMRANGTVSLVVTRVSDPAMGAPNFRDYMTATTVLLSGAYSYPVWSPDGKSLLYMQFKNNEYDLYLSPVTVTGTTISLQGNPIQLTQGGIDGDSRPSWTAV